VLNFSSFYNLKIKKTQFDTCKLKQVDFVNADLSEAKFYNSDLTASIFENTNLEKADFATAFNFSIDPEKNKITGAKFSANNLAGLLDRYKLNLK